MKINKEQLDELVRMAQPLLEWLSDKAYVSIKLSAEGLMVSEALANAPIATIPAEPKKPEWGDDRYPARYWERCNAEVQQIVKRARDHWGHRPGDIRNWMELPHAQLLDESPLDVIIDGRLDEALSVIKERWLGF